MECKKSSSRSDQASSPHHSPLSDDGHSGTFEVKAVVREEGYISMQLSHDMTVDIGVDQSIRVINTNHNSVLALSGCGTQMAIQHPNGRIWQYGSRIEMQSRISSSCKGAKIWARGISFTSGTNSLTYLVDEAGPRSTTELFHDLYCQDISNCLFLYFCKAADHPFDAWNRNLQFLNDAFFWRSEYDQNCWMINGVKIMQSEDGFVRVEVSNDHEVFVLRSSPSNGKVGFQSSFMYATASLGANGHIFVKSNERRVHSNRQAFVVRYGGHIAGFDQRGNIKIW